MMTVLATILTFTISHGTVTNETTSTQSPPQATPVLEATVDSSDVAETEIGADLVHADHQHGVESPSPYPVLWTHGCGWTATYYVWPGRINHLWCYSCAGRFVIYGE